MSQPKHCANGQATKLSVSAPNPFNPILSSHLAALWGELRGTAKCAQGHCGKLALRQAGAQNVPTSAVDLTPGPPARAFAAGPKARGADRSPTDGGAVSGSSVLRWRISLALASPASSPSRGANQPALLLYPNASLYGCQCTS